MSRSDELKALAEKIRKGGAPKYHQANAAAGKLFCRERIALLCDDGGKDFVEDGLFANAGAPELPADGVVTGVGRVHGRPVAIMANDSTVKAGSWGARTVEKIVRIQETAGRLRIPLFYLVDSAGARITDQIDMFPGRRHAGRIFNNQVKLSGAVPQICLLFGPSAAGGAYIPAFCDVVFMVEKNASMYLGSPRMAEMVIGEKVTLEEMGGARMHCEVSGCGDLLAKDETRVHRRGARLPRVPAPARRRAPPAAAAPRAPRADAKRIDDVLPANQNQAFDIAAVIDALVDEGSFFELKKLFAREIVTGFARLDGRVVGIVANQPKWKGGVLFVDSADKAARFIWLCDAFGIPLLFLADVPGFMIGKAVERQGIIRHGAKMLSAMADATVPRICVVLRKAYGAGPLRHERPRLRARRHDRAAAGHDRRHGRRGRHQRRLRQQDRREARGRARRATSRSCAQQYREDIDILKLAAELHVDAITPGDELRAELVRRFANAARQDRHRATRAAAPVLPV